MLSVLFLPSLAQNEIGMRRGRGYFIRVQASKHSSVSSYGKSR